MPETVKSRTEHPDFELSQLKPHPKNPKEHTEVQIDHIAKSLNTFDWAQPIVCDEDFNILIGHGRWLAAQKAGLTRAPVWVMRGYSDDEKRALMIADNKLNMDTGWIIENLKELVEGIALESVALDELGLNFDFAEATPDTRTVDENTLEKDKETFDRGLIKQIVLMLDADAYEQVLGSVGEILEAPPEGESFQNNTEVFLWALRSARQTAGYDRPSEA